jgi:hypothetical protein
MTYKTAQRQYVLSTVAYVALTIVVGVAGAIIDTRGVWIASAAALSIAASANMLAWVRRERSREGVEQQVGSEAAAFTLFTLVPALFSYSLFELWAGAPRPSTLVVASIAAALWGGWHLITRRRLA